MSYGSDQVGLSRVQYFYQEANRISAQIANEVLSGRLPWQPKPVTAMDPITGAYSKVDAVYITSVKVANDPNSFAGNVVGATLQLASRNIVSGTHRLSTAEEVEAYFKAQADRKAAYDLEDSRLSGGTKALKIQVPKAAEVK